MSLLPNTKPLCPAGHEMLPDVIRDEQSGIWACEYEYQCGWRSPSRCGKTKEEAVNLALSSALRRYTNR